MEMAFGSFSRMSAVSIPNIEFTATVNLPKLQAILAATLNKLSIFGEKLDRARLSN
jgi:hypothetical protein